jgi:malic enzyme
MMTVHGTAIISICRGLLNALELAEKKIENAKIIVSAQVLQL